MADITPPDYSTAVGKVRLLCTDVTSPYVFTDVAIQAFLDVNGQNVKRAAASALDVIASDEALVVQVVRTDDLSVNGAQVADALRKNAQALRDDAQKEEDALLDESFTVVFDTEPCYPEGVTFPVYGRLMGVGRCR